MATNTIDIRIVNAGGSPSPTPPPPSGYGGPPPPLPNPAASPNPPGPTNAPTTNPAPVPPVGSPPPPNGYGGPTPPLPTPSQPANPPGIPPPPSGYGAPPSPLPPPNPVPPRFGPQSTPIPGAPNVQAIPINPRAAPGSPPAPSGYGAPQPSPFVRDLNDLLDRTRLQNRDELIERAEQHRRAREQWLEEYQQRREQLRREEVQKRQLLAIGSVAVLNQMLGTANAYATAQRQIQGQRIRGQQQEADVAERDANVELASDAVGYVGAGIGFAVGGPLGSAIGYGVGRIVKGIGDLFGQSQKAFLERSKAFDEVIARSSQFSPDVANAKAMREVNQFRLNLREAETLGPDLARLEEAKARLDTVNAIRTLSGNIATLERQIKETNEKADGAVKNEQLLLKAMQMLGSFSEEQIKKQKEIIKELKKANQKDTDFGPTNDFLKAGRLLGGDTAQRGRKLDSLEDGMLNVPLLMDFK